MAKVLSLEFNNRNIKLLEGSKKGNRLTIYKNILLDIAPGNIDDGNIINMDNVVYTIFQSIRKNKIKVKKAIFTVNTNSTISRNIELPILKSKSETMSMIKNELGQLMPIDLNQYKLIYKRLDRIVVDGVDKGKYMVYGIPLEMYKQYIELAEFLKLNLLALDLSFNCLDKIVEKEISINKDPLRTDTGIAFIEIGYDNITFSVVNNGKNDFTRISTNGLDDIVKNFSTVFDLNYEEALDEIEKISLLEVYESPKYNIFEENINIWMDELSRYIRYYNSTNKERQIDKIFLYGNHSNIEGLPEYIELGLHIKTELINSVSNVKISEKANIPVYFSTLLSQHIDKNDINFLSEVKKRRKSKFSKGVALFAVSIAVVLSLAFCGYTYYIEKTSLEKNIASLDAFINKEENINLNEEAISLRNKTLLMEKYIEEVENLQRAIQNENAVNTFIFEQIAKAIPYQTNLKTIFIDNGRIQIQCTSLSREEVAQFEKNLKSIEFIDNVYIPSITDKADGESNAYTYSIVCSMKEVIVNEAE